MNAQVFSFVRYLAFVVAFSLAVSLLTFLPGDRLQAATDDCNCHPWEYCDSDQECHDLPHVHHYHGGHHEPAGGETCWVECLCEEGTSPGADNCAPCSFVGTVCIQH